MLQGAGRREWLGLGVLALACLLYSMDLSVLSLAVPSLAAELRPTSAQLLWITDIYGFLLAGSLITMGTGGDRIGPPRLLLCGAAGFAAASVLAAYASTAARDTLGGAVAAGQLPNRLQATLLDTTRQAFTQGLQVSATMKNGDGA
jgi:DHA2 family multidrug resistance protein-like MFS transporter